MKWRSIRLILIDTKKIYIMKSDVKWPTINYQFWHHDEFKHINRNSDPYSTLEKKSDPQETLDPTYFLIQKLGLESPKLPDPDPKLYTFIDISFGMN